MGFLLGAFGKLMARRRVSDIQAKLMRVQSRHRIATRNVDRVTKSLKLMKDAEINGLNMQNMALKQANALNLQSQYGVLNPLATDADTQKKLAEFQQIQARVNAQTEYYITDQKQQIEERYQMMEDTMLEPLKMESENLECEKDTLESQLKIAEQDYEACKKMEDAGAKNLAPQYTSQG